MTNTCKLAVEKNRGKNHFDHDWREQKSRNLSNSPLKGYCKHSLRYKTFPNKCSVLGINGEIQIRKEKVS